MILLKVKFMYNERWCLTQSFRLGHIDVKAHIGNSDFRIDCKTC